VADAAPPKGKVFNLIPHWPSAAHEKKNMHLRQHVCLEMIEFLELHRQFALQYADCCICMHFNCHGSSSKGSLVCRLRCAAFHFTQKSRRKKDPAQTQHTLS
jgi:hypothetical protein